MIYSTIELPSSSHTILFLHSNRKSDQFYRSSISRFSAFLFGKDVSASVQILIEPDAGEDEKQLFHRIFVTAALPDVKNLLGKSVNLGVVFNNAFIKNGINIVDCPARDSPVELFYLTKKVFAVTDDKYIKSDHIIAMLSEIKSAYEGKGKQFILFWIMQGIKNTNEFKK